ncbi:MAG: amidohydrolase [Marmoricola sp.]|nr:amidohydrolase [Marmoricola sp.]
MTVGSIEGGTLRNIIPDRYDDLAEPITGLEDFSRVLAAVTGAFVFIGATLPGHDPETAPSNHSPRADFDPGVLPDAAEIHAELAVRRLDAFAAGR